MPLFKPGGDDAEEKPALKITLGASNDDMGSAAKKSAMKDFRKALEAGDLSAMSTALEAHYEACEGPAVDEEE